MKNYIYPDINDKITSFYINTMSNNKYWTESENNVINIYINYLKKIGEKVSILDLGCGEGRLFSSFIPFANSIIALEPDKKRFMKAKQEALKINANKIQVYNTADIDTLDNLRFGAIIISHLFQHITNENTQKIIKKLYDISTEGCLLYVTTTYTNFLVNQYTIEYMKEGKRICQNVDEKTFNMCISKKGFLPVKLVSPNYIIKIFKENGFALKEMCGYHFKDKFSITNDNEMNKNGTLDNAKDVLYIFRKE